LKKEEKTVKRSTAYKMAQLSVLTDEGINAETKLFILSILMEDEGLSKWQENQESTEVTVD
jgi:hypothetical protein